MFQLLHAYLIENRSLYLPGTGQLELVRQPAVYDVANKLLHPPHTLVRFTNSGTEVSQQLYDFLAAKLDITTNNAALLYHTFCQKLKADIHSQSSVQWQHFGVFSKEPNGEIIFQSNPSLGSINQPVTAVRIIRQGSAHSMLVGDRESTNTQMQEYFTEQALERPNASRWWIAPLVIGLVALVFILLKKMNYL